MSFYSRSLNSKPASLRSSHQRGLAFVGLITVVAGWAVITSIGAPSNVDGQISRALGCRGSPNILTLTLQSDGRILWPDGVSYTVTESTLLLHTRVIKEETVLAILAQDNALMTQVIPLLNEARKLDVAQAILATPQNYKLP